MNRVSSKLNIMKFSEQPGTKKRLYKTPVRKNLVTFKELGIIRIALDVSTAALDARR